MGSCHWEEGLPLCVRVGFVLCVCLYPPLHFIRSSPREQLMNAEEKKRWEQFVGRLVLMDPGLGCYLPCSVDTNRYDIADLQRRFLEKA